MKQRAKAKIAAVAAVFSIGSAIFLTIQHWLDPFGLGSAGAIAVVACCGLLAAMLLREHFLRLRATDSKRKLLDLSGVEQANTAALKEQNEWLRMTERLAHVGHWRMKFSDNSLHWSEETYKIHGWDLDRSLVLEDAISVYHPDDRDDVNQAVETARQTGKPYSFRARLIRPDGETRHVEAVAQIECDDRGTPVAMFGVLADRTHEHEMREALVKASDEAFAAAQAKSTFLATMSHEIRTPMNGVLGFADLLSRSDLPPREKQFVEMIGDSARAMTMLLNDILDLSKIEAGELQVREEPTDIAHLANHAARLVQPQAREKGLEVRLHIDDDLPQQSITDPLRLRQILANLLGNAVKFTEQGFVALRVCKRGDEVEFTVRDTGPGIAAQEQETVFDAFAQAGANSFSAQGGTGLGLAISRRLAELLGGSIELTSTPGEGCTFTLLVRAPEAVQKPAFKAADDRPAANDSASPKGGRHRVLLAEDYDINQMLVEAMAEQAGIELEVADNGQIALAMIEEASAKGTPYALVLMDLQMPVMDGLDAAARLRSNGFDAEDLPIVAMTANAFPEDIAECRKAGMQDHLAKPLTFEQFRHTLTKWLPGDTQRAA